MINYIDGDVLEVEPEPGRKSIIAHICNDAGGWGAGFVVAISKKWKEPEEEYRRWYKLNGQSITPFRLGEIQVVQVRKDLAIANMIAQHSYGFKGDTPPIRYDRVRQCLNKLALVANTHEASVLLPRIGCGLAGGTWQVIEGIIKETLIAKNIEVYVYTLPNDNSWNE